MTEGDSLGIGTVGGNTSSGSRSPQSVARPESHDQDPTKEKKMENEVNPMVVSTVSQSSQGHGSKQSAATVNATATTSAANTTSSSTTATATATAATPTSTTATTTAVIAAVIAEASKSDTKRSESNGVVVAEKGDQAQPRQVVSNSVPSSIVKEMNETPIDRRKVKDVSSIDGHTNPTDKEYVHTYGK